MLGLSRSELRGKLPPGLPKFTADQLFQAIYRTGIRDVNAMTALSLQTRAILNSSVDLGLGTALESLESTDGTRKWLLNFSGNRSIETVYIPQVNASGHTGTLCLSSQIGCSLACKFCHTGTQKFLGNLSDSEIIAQVLLAMHSVRDLPLNKHVSRNITNFVYMGQGEPLYNFASVSKAILFVNQVFGYAPWRTTVSTSGVVPLMGRVSKDLKACLAVSLHAVNDTLRDDLVPLNKIFPITEVLKGCRAYLEGLENPRNQNYRITFEYVMLDSINDSLIDAKHLVKLLRDLPAHVNLIPFNPWPGTAFTCSSMDKILVC